MERQKKQRDDVMALLERCVLYKCVCVCVCVCACVRVCMYVHVHMYLCMLWCMHVCIHMCAAVFMRMCVCAHDIMFNDRAIKRANSMLVECHKELDTFTTEHQSHTYSQPNDIEMTNPDDDKKVRNLNQFVIFREQFWGCPFV